jgi:hypothetical protein
MNPALESVPETVETSEPLLITEGHITALTDPELLLKSLEGAKRLMVTLRPTDDITVKQCAALVETCSVAWKHAEKRRTDLVSPHNLIVDNTNAIWQPIVKGFKQLAQLKAAEISQYVEEERQKAQRLQQKAIDDAKAEQDRLTREAEAARLESERIRKEADQAKTIEEAEILHQQADKLEKKADVKELKAEQVVTEVVPQQAKTIDIGTSSFSTRAPKKTWVLAGWDKSKPLRLTDPKLSKLIGDITQLPEGVQFALRYSDLNPVYLNKAFGEVVFPEPFGTADEYKGSQSRGK